MGFTHPHAGGLTEMLLHSPLSWTLVQNAVAPLSALVLLTAATVPAPPPSGPADDAAHDAADDEAAAAVEAMAIDLAHELRAVPADDTDRLCARDDLSARWTEPIGFRHGAHVGLIGPAPGADTVAVNGVVVCGDSTWAYMGFEAQRVASEWQVTAVPYLEESHGDVASLNLDADPDPHGANDHEDTHADGDADGHAAPDEHAHGAAPASRAAAGTPARAPAPSPSAPTARVAQSDWLAGLGPIEPYAAYEPQRSCSPTVKAGTGVLRDTLLGTHPQTRNLGVVRACHIGGRSEHKEGRAFDWGAYVNRPVERAAVERFLTQLFATDADGNTHALARRLGVMYVVWDGQIWASHRAQEGWRRYQGPNPHVDHIHISLSWAGGLGQTSFFTQDLAGKGVLGLVPPGGTPLATDDTPLATVPVAGQESAPPSAGWASTPTPTSGGAGGTNGTTGGTAGGKTGGTTSGGTGGTSKDESTEDGAHSGPSATPAPATRPDDTDADHARREAEKEQRKAAEEQRKAAEEQRRIEEEQRRAREREIQKQREQQRREEEKQGRAETKQAQQQAVAPQHTQTDTGSADKGNGNGGGKGGGKGKG